MSELGEVLELLHRARRSWTTVQADVRRWSRRDGREQEGSFTVAIAGPGRFRLVPRSGVIPIHRRIASFNAGRPVETGDDNPVALLFDPSAVASRADLAVVGQGEVAGRPVRMVEATPHPGASMLGTPPGADRYVLSVDDERGVLLRLEACRAGEPVTVTEVTAVTFDQPLDDELFEPGPPAPTAPRPERVTIEEAARRAPFTVFVPTRLPEGSTLSVRVAEAVGPRPFTVSLAYRLAHSLHFVDVTEMAGATGADDVAGAVSRTTVVRGGTRVDVATDLGIEAARAIAGSLVPAPTEPPSFP